MSDEKRDVKLTHTRMKPFGFGSVSQWELVVPSGVTREDILKPSFWACVAEQCHQGDLLDVRIDDETFFAQYYVISCSRVYAQVFELNWFDLSDAKTEKLQKSMEKHEYKYRGPYAKHSILRKSDGAVMVEKLDTKEAAIKWLFDYEQKI